MYKNRLTNNLSNNLCRLVRIMFSIPPNTGWVECAYSILECSNCL